MAFPTSTLMFFSLLVATFSVLRMATAGDPDIVTDFIVSPGQNTIDGSFFTFTGMKPIFGNSEAPPKFTVLKASMAEFPALNGQSVSYAVLAFPNGTVNPPHTHPRSAELLFLVYGSLQVGFVDTTNKLYTQTLQTGDMFVFPKGLVHFQYNSDPKSQAFAFSAFGSANAGTVSLPNTLFNTSVDSTVLAKAFKTDVATIETLKTGLKG